MGFFNSKIKKMNTLAFIRSLFVIVILVSLSTVSSRALFTDTFEVDSNAFTAGSVDIAASPAQAAVTMSNMKPGDSASGVINVANSGSLDFSYDLSAKKDAGLSEFYNELTAKVETAGTVLFDGMVKDLLNLPTGRRVLTPGAAEDLTVTIGLPLTAPNTLNKKYATVAFDFAAEQM